MDDANYVYDEIFNKLWHKIFKFCVFNITDDTIYRIYHIAIRYVYRDYIHL